MIAWFAPKRPNNEAEVDSPFTADEPTRQPDAIDRAVAFLLGQSDIALAQGGVGTQAACDSSP